MQDYWSEIEKENFAKLCCVIAAVLLGVFLVWYMADVSASKNEINKRIAQEFGITYSSSRELDNRVDFYEFHAATRGDKSGCYYIVDGVEHVGDNSEINFLIRSFVDAYCS